MCLECLDERDFSRARGNHQTANFYARESVTGNCSHIRQWQAHQLCQRVRYGGSQPEVGHHHYHYGGGHLDQGNHPRGTSGGGSVGLSGAAGIRGDDGRGDHYYSDSDSHSDSSSWSSDDGWRSRGEPYRLAPQGLVVREPAGRQRIVGSASTGGSIGVQGFHTSHDFRGVNVKNVPNVQGTSEFVDDGQRRGGMKGSMGDRAGRMMDGILGGRLRGIMGGRRGGNKNHGGHRGIDKTMSESQRLGGMGESIKRRRGANESDENRENQRGNEGMGRTMSGGHSLGGTGGIMRGGRFQNRRRGETSSSYDESHRPRRRDSPPSYDESQRQYNSR